MNQMSLPAPSEPILEIKDLKTYIFLAKSTVRAVDGVNLALGRKTTLGLVGESGCGKGVMAMSIMRLIQSPPSKIVDGAILLHDKKTGRAVDIARLAQRQAENAQTPLSGGQKDTCCGKNGPVLIYESLAAIERRWQPR